MRSTPPDVARSGGRATDAAGSSASALRETTSAAPGARFRVLISAYACGPGEGSEPGVGWNIALEMAKRHDVWLLTRANNRASIEAAVEREGVAINRVYYDLPRWASWWKRGGRGIRLYYYLWQIGAYRLARRLHREVSFDLVHHATFVRYWAPSFVALLPTPFLWGPVGGGETMPTAFLPGLGARGRRYEAARRLAQRIGERDPFVRLTARKSALALATTRESAERLRELRCREVRILGAVGVGQREAEQFDALARPSDEGIRFVSVGRLLPWKGFHLGLQAFARAAIGDAQLWIIGEGPERRRLEDVAAGLGISARVRFLGALPRRDTLAALAGCRALIHPSLHDSGGLVCLEAMLARLPVVCLALGGPATMVDDETGFIAGAESPEAAVHDMAAAISALARDPALARRMGSQGRARALGDWSWARKGELLDAAYRDAVAAHRYH